MTSQSAFLTQGQRDELATSAVRINQQPGLWLSLNSKFRNSIDPPNDFTLSKEGTSFQLSQITRMAVAYVNNFPWFIPNVNNYDRYVTIKASLAPGGDAGVYTFQASMPLGIYNLDDFAVAMKIALNALICVSVVPNDAPQTTHIGANFHTLAGIAADPFIFGICGDATSMFTGQTKIQQRYYIGADTGKTIPPFSFILSPQCENIDLSNLSGYSGRVSSANITSTPSSFLISGLNDLMYTNTAYISSPDIMAYNPLVDQTSNARNVGDILAELFPNPGDFGDRSELRGGGQCNLHYTSYNVGLAKWFAYIPTRSIGGSIRIRLLDMWGNLLAIMPDFFPDFEVIILAEQNRNVY